MNSESTCSICLENLECDGCELEIVKLDCNHFFHKCCIYRINSNSCPICRNSIIDINKLLNVNTLAVCCPSRCTRGYEPFLKNGSCRNCYGYPLFDCV